MYSKQQAALATKQFWTAFGLYMSPVPSAEGEKINWINYKTGVKHVHFRMDAGKSGASIGIEITHPEIAYQAIFYKKFSRLHSLLYDALQEEWQWQLQTTDARGKTVTRIFTEIANLSVFNQQDWPALISFFKPKIIALDRFWCEARYAFENL